MKVGIWSGVEDELGELIEAPWQSLFPRGLVERALRLLHVGNEARETHTATDLDISRSSPETYSRQGLGLFCLMPFGLSGNLTYPPPSWLPP